MTHHLDAAASHLKVWSYKEGLLSRVAHDLCLEARELTADLSLDGDRFQVEVVVPVRSLKVLGQVKGGEVNPLKAKDHTEIEGNMTGPKVLDAGRYPEVRYTGRGERRAGTCQVAGELTLHGQTHPLAFPIQLREEDDGLRVEGEVRFDQTRFGIKPFSAMFGALKVKDGLRVSWSLRYARA